MPEQTESRPSLATGVVVDRGRGEPVAGVRLTVQLRLENSCTHDVAAGLSDAGGRFSLLPAEEVADWVVRVVTCGEGEPVTVLGALGDREPQDLGTTRLGEFLALTIDVPAADVDWAALARDGEGRVDELLALVRDPAVVPDQAVRVRAVTELEAAFLDPSGTLSQFGPLPPWHTLAHDFAAYEAGLGDRADAEPVRQALRELRTRLDSFADLSQVDWPIDFGALGQTGLADVLNRYADRFTTGHLLDGPRTGALLPLVGYRDYLLTVWTKLCAYDDYWLQQGGEKPLTAAQARAQLTARFHQDFTTRDTTARPANELVIGVVTRILTEPAPTGYGLPAGSLPDRGDLDARSYLDKLVGLSGVTARELGLRFRLDLARADQVTSSPVAENVATLLGFFRDSFQSQPDPFHTPPDVRNRTIIPDVQRGRAPFFLEYEEWLAATAPFHPENVFSMGRCLRAGDLASTTPAEGPAKAWQVKAIAVFADIAKIEKLLLQSEYPQALNLLDTTTKRALELVNEQQKAGYPVDPPLQARKRLPVTTKPQLAAFERYLGSGSSYVSETPYDFPFPGDWTVKRMTAALVLHAMYFAWVWRSDALLAVGRFTEAAKCLEGLSGVAVGAAGQDDPAGYQALQNAGVPSLYTDGPLPFTLDRSDSPQIVQPDIGSPDAVPYGSLYDDYSRLRPPKIAGLLHRVDRRFVLLRLGSVLLEWADALFRADDPASTARARELYKAVLWLHGDDPRVSPAWQADVLVLLGGYTSTSANPAVVAQAGRARLGFTRIEAGLNYFGATEDTVPVQRYRTLKDAADRFAALAKAAERDFLAATAHLEDLAVERLRTSNLLAKATAQKAIAGEQAQIAAYQVQVAQQQVADVEAQIAAKKAEIADHDSFFGQLSDFGSGLVKTFTGLPGFATKGIGEGFAAEAGLGDSSASGLLGLGAGASVLAGFGAFYYAGYTSMSGMAAAYAGRAGELKRLQDVALPLARGNVDAKQREVTIARLQATVADADIRLAGDLLAFGTLRLLNAEFWTAVTQVLRRVLRRYLDLGAWAGWLAERALAFEQDRRLRVIRMDYLARDLAGVTGADQLQGDLAELEATRVAGERALVPYRCAVSLAEEFPLAFGALKAHGQCSFATTEASARAFFPGTFGHRVRSVAVEVRMLTAGRRVRGTLVNHGVSQVSTDETLATRPLLRFPDAIAVSESGTPAPEGHDVLGPFEGIGLDTGWTLHLDRAAGATAWDTITDVVLRIDGLARFSDALRLNPAAPAPRRLLLISAARFAPDALAAVKAGGGGQLEIDLAKVPYPAGEANRRIANVLLALPGGTGPTVAGTLDLAGATAAFTFDAGTALSNGEPLRLPGSPTPDQPLNAVLGEPVEQPWRFTLTPDPGADLANLRDLVVGVEYTADPE
ncbi:Tc toxin subunit A-related protein [Amycolatopsis sp. NPDC003865]